MDTRSSVDFWYEVVGGTDDEDSDFVGFTQDDDMRNDPADAESDLDIDLEAVEDGIDAADSDSDTDVQMTFLTLDFLFAFIFE